MNSKAKGSQFERECCVALSLWVTEGKRKDCFWRSAMSGGRATVQGRNVRQAGDICAVAPEGHWLTDKHYIECRHHKSLDFQGLFKRSGNLVKFWDEVQTKARAHHKTPWLIAKQNMCPVILCTAHGLMLEPLLFAPTYYMHIYLFDTLLQSKLTDAMVPA